MEREIVERKLTTILSADVVGYSRLMGGDEAGTLAALKTHRKELLEPKAAQYNGRTVKLMGDGALMEFGSVVDAVLFATEVQCAMRQRNADVGEDRQIVYRIGINIGDIIVEGDDIYGDGVNVAARLEGLAEPGGICLSRTVFNHVKGKVDLAFEDMGEHQVKNIADPVSAYRIVLDDRAKALATPVVHPAAAGRLTGRRYATATALLAVLVAAVLAWWQPWGPDVAPASVERMAFALPDKPSIAILPFANISGDAEQGYFADGLTEDLITDLAKIPALFVIARNSTFVYKDKPTNVQQVAEELAVRYVLEGSVRRTGDQLRINAQLIDALTGYHVWAERFDGSFAEIFDFQDRVMNQIVANIAAEMTGGSVALERTAETDIPQAYDAFLQGWQYLQLGTREDHPAAIAELEKAIELDPEYSRAHAALAAAYWRSLSLTYEFAIGTDWNRILDRLNLHLAKALENPTTLALSVSSEVLVRRGRLEDALVQIEQAIVLGPSEAGPYLSKARVLNAIGRADEAEDAARTAMRLDPHYPPDYLRALGLSLFHQKRYDEALAVMQRVVTRQPDIAEDYVTIAAIYGHLGRSDGIDVLVEKFNAIWVAIGLSPLTVMEMGYWWYGDMFDFDVGYREHLLAGMRKAGIPEGAADQLEVADYKRLINRSSDGEYDVEGAIKIDAAMAGKLHDRGVTFVDVRAAGSYDPGHIPGAANLDLIIDLTEESLSQVVATDDEVVFNCFGKYCPYSAYASAKAVVWGFTRVYYFAGGFPAWADVEYPVETTVEND